MVTKQGTWLAKNGSKRNSKTEQPIDTILQFIWPKYSTLITVLFYVNTQLCILKDFLWAERLAGWPTMLFEGFFDCIRFSGAFQDWKSLWT